MEVVEVNQVEEVAEPTVCEQPLELVPEEVPTPVDNPVEEPQPKPKRGVGRAKGFKPPKVKVEKKVFQEERVLEELGHLLSS